MHDEILKLKQLLDQGVLTEEEFAAAKRKLLGMDGSVQQAKETSDPKPITKPVPPPSKSGFAPASYKEPSLPSYVSQTKSTMECPKCHEPIPQSAVVCPACGCSISTINRSAKECPRCRRKYSSSETVCPFCSNEKEQKTASNQYRFLSIIVAFVLVVCFVNYLVEYNKDFKPKSSYTASQTSSIAAQSHTSTPKPVATSTVQSTSSTSNVSIPDLPFFYKLSANVKTSPVVGGRIPVNISVKNTSEKVLYIQIKDSSGNFVADTNDCIQLQQNQTHEKSFLYYATRDDISSSKIAFVISYAFVGDQQMSYYEAVFEWGAKKVASPTPTPTSKSAANTYSKTSVSSYTSSKVSEDLKYALIDVTKKRVSNHLKAPSTAKFPSYKEWSVAKGEANVYNVIGYVDSQNSFGAMIRETVGAMIQYDGTYSSVVMIQIGDNIYLD